MSEPFLYFTAVRQILMLHHSTLFYLSGVFISGLLVPLDNPGLKIADKTGRHSPFVIAFKLAGWKVVGGEFHSEHYIPH